MSSESSNRVPKFNYDIRKLTLTIASGTKDTGFVNIPALCNGQLVSIETVAPDLNDDAAFKIHLLSKEGSNLIGALLDAITDNSTQIVFILDTLRRMLKGDEQVKITCATDQGADREITLIFGISSVGL